MTIIKKLMFLLLIFLSSSVFGVCEFELVACAVFKDEGPYLREWICFHRAQGVERFYLYDNSSCDRWNLEIADFICEGFVEIIPWPFHACDCKEFEEIRCKAYMNCIRRIKKKARWCAFLSCNEFLFSPSGLSLNILLNKFRKQPCLCIKRHVYGTSNIFQAPCGALVRHLLWKCHPDHACCKNVCCLIQPKFVIGCKSCREFILKPGFDCVNANKKKVKGCCGGENIRINYYIFRDIYFYNTYFWNNFCCRCPCDKGCIEGFTHIDCNLIHDPCILNCCPPLEACYPRGPCCPEQ